MSAAEALELRVSERTAPGSGGLSVLLLEGAGAFDCLESWSVRDLRVGELRFAHIEFDGQCLDEALVCVLSERAIELHIHGSPPLVQLLLRSVPGALERVQPRGIEARALRALPHAVCELAARVLLDQTQGAWAAECRALLLASDRQLQVGLEQWATRSCRLRRALEPARVQIAGPVNAGKSTLFNALVASERVITSEQAGTTRDLVMERAQLGLWPILLIDGAGQRAQPGGAGQAAVEGAGQDLAREQAARADWILWLSPAPGLDPPEFDTHAPVTQLASCCDRQGADGTGISAREDPLGAVRRVSELFHLALDLPHTLDLRGRAVAFDHASRRWLEKVSLQPRLEQRQALERELEAQESRTNC